MTQRKPRDNFILASAALMETQVGQQFHAALKAMAENSQRELVFAPKEHLDYAQGVSRTYLVMSEEMANAKENAAKIVAAEKTRS